MGVFNKNNYSTRACGIWDDYIPGSYPLRVDTRVYIQGQRSVLLRKMMDSQKTYPYMAW